MRASLWCADKHLYFFVMGKHGFNALADAVGFDRMGGTVSAVAALPELFPALFIVYYLRSIPLLRR